MATAISADFGCRSVSFWNTASTSAALSLCQGAGRQVNVEDDTIWVLLKRILHHGLGLGHLSHQPVAGWRD